MEEDVALACHKIQNMLHNKDKTEEKKDGIKSRCSNQNVKIARKIVLSLLQRFTADNAQKEDETTLIIEVLQPFINNCIISQVKGADFKW